MAQPEGRVSSACAIQCVYTFMFDKGVVYCLTVVPVYTSERQI